MKSRTSLIGALGLSALLAGCGGGGGGGTTAASTATTTAATAAAEGVYTGSTSTGSVFDTVVLDDGTYYAIYGTNGASGLTVNGFVQGQGTSGATTFTSSNLRDFTYTGSTLSGTLSATYTPGVSVSGTVTESSGSSTFTGNVPQSSSYVYNTPADINTVSGNWTANTLQGAGAPVSLTINTNGTFSGAQGNCSFSGTLTPRASGKNIFDVTVNFGPTPCVLANGTASGIGLSYLTTNSATQQTTRQLLVAVVDPTRQYGTLLFGQR